ncbi:MAG: hypothetical protein CVU59_07065 [Deltaproteobacteria bacterium HGW-Deltaproteobacteria-17]|nr:MAG: hypothetical protein CVU59_07065 [Deltaproteobacteria bacterium HGW-Deltaproteobacteria-17]
MRSDKLSRGGKGFPIAIVRRGCHLPAMDLTTLATSLRTPDHEGEMLFLLPVHGLFPHRNMDFITGELRLMMLAHTLQPVRPDLWRGIPELERARELHALFVPGRRTETVRSILKAAFWPPPMTCAPPTFAAVTGGDAVSTPLDFDLRHAGWFFPGKPAREKRLVCRSFDHQQIYRLRFDTERLRSVHPLLARYVRQVVDHCPNHLFFQDGLRCSSFPGHATAVLHHEERHEMCKLTADSFGVTEFKARHENCQYHFLTRDPFTVGVEVPVWLEARELEDFAEVFGGSGPLTGHIDLVREKGGAVEVWDYKPHARRERHAATQVFLYTFMLSVRTGILLRHFRCGYFDERDCYTFSPLGIHLFSGGQVH